MSSFPVPFLLLIAVAFGQIFGGVSCCCLSRSLLDGWTPAGESTESISSAQGSGARANLPGDSNTSARKCPRCAKVAVTPRPPNEPSPRSPVDGCKSNDSSQCDCVEHFLEADRPSEGGSATETSHSWLTFGDLSSQPRSQSRHLARITSPPLRVRGLSWQALACIWTT